MATKEDAARGKNACRSTPACRWFPGRSSSLFSLEGRRTGRGLWERAGWLEGGPGGRAAGAGRAFLRSWEPEAGLEGSVRAARLSGPGGLT